MNKKIKLLLSVFVISALIIPANYVNAKSYKNEQGINTEKILKKKNQNDKHLKNMLKVISKRIDSISKEISKIEEQINSYFNIEVSKEDSSIKQEEVKKEDIKESEKDTGEEIKTDKEIKGLYSNIEDIKKNIDSLIKGLDEKQSEILGFTIK